MTEAIVCAVIAAIAAVTVGLINAFSQKKTKQDLSAEFQKELQEAREKERARQKYEVYMIKGIMASNTLSEETARAVQRIPDAHCNGDMETALEEEEKVKKEEGKKLMKYYDDQGNELNIRTELDDMLDELYDKLDKMTPEERMAWYSSGMYVKPLKYTQEIDNTIYIMRTNFNENADSTVYDTVERIKSKDI